MATIPVMMLKKTIGETSLLERMLIVILPGIKDDMNCPISPKLAQTTAMNANRPIRKK